MTEVTVHDFVVAYNYVTNDFRPLGRGFMNVGDVKSRVDELYEWDEYTILVQIKDVNGHNDDG